MVFYLDLDRKTCKTIANSKHSLKQQETTPTDAVAVEAHRRRSETYDLVGENNKTREFAFRERMIRLKGKSLI